LVLETFRSIPLEPQVAGKITDLLKQRSLIVSAVVSGGPGAELFGDYIRRFWTYEKSSCVIDKHAHDQWMRKPHCFESPGRAEKYWIPYFTGKHLAEISRADLKEARINNLIK
jgi:hypothetical protein